jgi:DNA-binding response OmpR family regulator
MNKKRIIVVEDGEDDADFTKLALMKNNLMNNVSIATDGAMALELLLNDSEVTPGLVLLDLNLPKISGLDVLKRLRNNDKMKLVPIVVLSSSREESDLRNCYEAGANSYVRKPIDFNDYMTVIGEIAHYWLKTNELPILQKVAQFAL